MKSNFICWSLPFLAMAIPPCATARENTQPVPPKEYTELITCRTISDRDARLACFDRSVENLNTATQTKDIVITDREAVATARRGLFGFAASAGKLLGINSSDEEEIKQVDSTITRVGRGQSGWRIALEDGSLWEQNDTRDFVLSPKVGNSVKITRGALGAFFVSVQNQRAIKMRRTQ